MPSLHRRGQPFVWISLSWPAKILSPNKAGWDWRVRHGAKVQARGDGFVLGLEAHQGEGAGPLLNCKLEVWLIIHPPDKRKRDLDNVLASLKSAIDGVAEGLGVNDSAIKRLTLEWGDNVKGGSIDMGLRKYAA
jgi:crossover junction endodeoxyribonuclease RusA